MNKKILIYSFMWMVTFSVQAMDCPKKVKWKRLKTEEQVRDVLISCLPMKTQKAEIEFFLKEHKAIFSENENGIIYASVLARSKSLWIEKQWLMEFVLDKDERLIEIRVKTGLTGP